jgi:hypothetical protein
MEIVTHLALFLGAGDVFCLFESEMAVGRLEFLHSSAAAQ